MNINEDGCRPYGWHDLDGHRCIKRDTPTPTCFVLCNGDTITGLNYTSLSDSAASASCYESKCYKEYASCQIVCDVLNSGLNVTEMNKTHTSENCGSKMVWLSLLSHPCESVVCSVWKSFLLQKDFVISMKKFRAKMNTVLQGTDFSVHKPHLLHACTCA